MYLFVWEKEACCKEGWVGNLEVFLCIRARFSSGDLLVLFEACRLLSSLVLCT